MTQGAAGIQQNIKQVMPAATAEGTFVSLCTIQQPDNVFTDSGFPSGTFVNIAGLVNIPCMKAPQSMIRIAADERKAEAGIQSLEPSHVLLDAYYPAIPQVTPTRPSLRAIVDGINYEVMGVEHDSQLQMSRLTVRVATR